MGLTVRDRAVDPNKIAIYIRWSTDDQSDGTTLDVQMEGCKHYVISQGWAVSEELVFVDDGYSGGTLDRPALSRLRRMVKQGQVECVVVFKLDRLSRSVIDMVNLVLEEWDGLTYVKSAREPLDTSSAMGKQFFYMLVSFAEWERNVIRERTASGRLARAKEGYKSSSKAPYGYLHGDRKGSYSVDPVEAPVVQRIFEMYSSGLGAKAIVQHLNRQGIRFRGGKLWNERTLLYLLSNPVYIGRMVYGRLTKNPRRDKDSSEPYWLVNKNPLVVESSQYIPPLISEELFALAQQIKSRRRVGNGISPAAVASEHLLTGLARCPCGYGLYARRLSDRHAYYACLGKKIKGSAQCKAANIPMIQLDAFVAAEVKREYADEMARERFRRSLSVSLESAHSEVQAAEEKLVYRLAQLEQEERRIRHDYRQGHITPQQFSALTGDIAEELGDLRVQRQQLDIRRQEIAERQRALSAMIIRLGQIDKWNALTVAEQKTLLKSLVASVTVWRDPLTKRVDLAFTWKTDTEPSRTV